MAFAASNNNSGNTVTGLAAQNRGFVSGFDTKADQEAQNVICTHPGENAACSQEGAAAAAASTNLTCEQCFMKFLSGDVQIPLLLKLAKVTSLTELCDRLPRVIEAELEAVLIKRIGVSEPVAAQIIQCLIDAGIHFALPKGTM
jgi:hypothetical protein